RCISSHGGSRAVQRRRLRSRTAAMTRARTRCRVRRARRRAARLHSVDRGTKGGREMHRSERRALFLPSYLLLFLDPLGAQSSHELEIGTAAAREGAVATIPLRLKLPGPAKRGTMGTTDEV